ncbi:hypothetical protein BB560_006582, partial [Smittium megazygosporum]
MSSQSTIDLSNLETYLKQTIGIVGPLSAEKFSHGQSNPTFLIIDLGSKDADSPYPDPFPNKLKKRYVVRKKPSGALISKTAHAVEREYRVLKALGDNIKELQIPVPKVYCLCEDDSVLGTPFYVMEYIHGRIFKDPALSELPPQEQTPEIKALYYNEMVRVLSRLHSVDYRSIGLSGFGKHGGYYNRQLAALSKVHDLQAATIKKSSENSNTPDHLSLAYTDGHDNGALPQFYILVNILKKSYCPDHISIAHGDYKLDNVIFHPTKPIILGILDWELSTIGNPLSDLANMIQYMTVDIPSEDSLVRLYCSLSNLEYPLQGWTYAKAFALLRNAVISHGIRARLSIGQASSSIAAFAATTGPK